MNSIKSLSMKEFIKLGLKKGRWRSARSKEGREFPGANPISDA